jgi:hypothetical protein
VGIFKKIFGKEKRKEEELVVDELDEWIERKIEEEEKRRKERCKPLIKEILSLRDEIRRAVREIEQKDVSKLYKPFVTSKPLFTRGILHATGKLRGEEPENFLSDVESMLKSIQAVQLGPGRYVAAAFREESLNLGKLVKKVIQLKKELELRVDEEGRKNLEIALSDSKKLHQKLSDLRELREKDEKIRNEIEELHAEKENLERELERIEKSDEFLSGKRMEEDLKNLEDRRVEIERTILLELSQLRRAIKKFHKIAEKGDPRYAKKIEFLVRDPVKAFLSGIDPLLEDLKKSIEDRKIELEEKERMKMIAKIEEILGGNLGREWAGVREKEKELLERVSSSPILQRRREIEERIERIGEEVKGKNQSRERERLSEKEILNSILSLKNRIEKRLPQVKIITGLQSQSFKKWK